MEVKVDKKGTLSYASLDEEGKITMPDYVKNVSALFFNNEDIVEFYAPYSLGEVQDFAFNNCTNLKKIEFSNVDSIGNQTFRNCYSLESFKVDSLNYLGAEAFSLCGNLREVEINQGNIRNIERSTFGSCKSLKKVKLPDSIESIGGLAFYGCENLEKIKLPKSLRIINLNAFSKCSNLSEITFPANLISIEENAFRECKNLRKVKFPNSIKKLGRNCFSDCLRLESIELPESLEKIDVGCFNRCYSLNKITINNYSNLFARGIILKDYEYFLDLKTDQIIMCMDSDLSSSRYKKLNYAECESEFVLSNRGSAIIVSAMFNEEELEKKEIRQIGYLLEKITMGGINKNNYKRVAKSLYNSKEFVHLINNIKFSSDGYGDAETIIYDIFKFSYSLGAFSDNQIERQKACEFIKNVFDKGLLKVNNCHGHFESLKFREYNKELADFILDKKNFIELVNLERNENGFISRIINNFEKIKEFGRSNRGDQHYRKVTVDMCKEFCSKIKFDNVSDMNADIADEIGKYSRNQESFDDAVNIREEYLKIKKEGKIKDHIVDEEIKEKDIFMQIEEEKENIINNTKDALDVLNELANKKFTYELLSKYDAVNFVLGKYCSCCSHIEGVGYGIMRASILHPTCQNIVIRDDKGQIISKSTLYINKDEGYGLLNNIELNNNIDNKDKTLIYKKYVAAINEFVRIYNNKNKSRPINQINVGMNFNDLRREIEQNNEKVDILFKGIDFSKYGKTGQSYSGDWQNEQYVFWKKGGNKNGR